MMLFDDGNFIFFVHALNRFVKVSFKVNIACLDGKFQISHLIRSEMLQILVCRVFYLFFVFQYFQANLFSKMSLELSLLLLIHYCFNKGQNYEKIGSGAAEIVKFVLESDFKLASMIFEEPTSSDRNKLFVRIVCASFELLLSSWFHHTFNFLLSTLLARVFFGFLVFILFLFEL